MQDLSTVNTYNNYSFYTAIIDNSPDCVKIIDEQGQVQFMNQNGMCLMEIDDFAIVKGKYWWDFWGDEEKEFVRSKFHHALAGESQQFMARCATAKGTLKWWDVLITLLDGGENGSDKILVISRDVTSSKEQQDALTKMASSLKLATDSANVGTWSLNTQTMVLDWSPLHKRMWGYDEDRNDLTYDDWHKPIVPEDKEKAFAKVEEARVNHSFYEVEYRILRVSDGVTRWMKSSGLYHYNSDDIAQTLTGITIDVTREKEAEQALAFRKALLEAQNEAIPDAFLVVDTFGKIVSHNKNFAKIWEIPDDIIEKRDDEAALRVAMSKVKDPQGFIERVNYCYANPDIKAWDEVELKDGRIIERHGNKVEDENGVNYGWAWYFRDITERKKTESEIKESEARFRLLADYMPQHVWTSNANGNLTYVNTTLYTYTGLTPDKILKNIMLSGIIHPDDEEENMRKWKHSLLTGEIFINEQRLRESSGEFRWHLSRARPYKNKNGEIILWVGTSTDIHEQKVKEQKKDEFIGIASHEMKTPLTSAKGYLELLLSILERDSPSFLYANKANQAVERLHHFITELLDVSKIQNGQLNYNFQPFSFDGLLDEVTDNIQHASKKHRIEKISGYHGEVTGDRSRLMQVLVNLLNNAIKYSPDSDKVVIRSEEQDGKLVVAVSDTGIGMAKEHLERIFDRYYRVQEHAIYFQGLGIGLYLSSNIVKRHGGDMWASSEEGKGSTFYFSLPLQGNIL